MTEFGGKSIAKELVVVCIEQTGGANINVISEITGLPKKLIVPILGELTDEGVVEHNRVIWKMRR